MTFATSPVSARCFGAISNWLLFLTVVLWAECIIGYNCAVITRRDVNDIVEKSSEKTADEDKEVSVEAIKEPAKQSEYMNCFPATSCYEVSPFSKFTSILVFFFTWEDEHLFFFRRIVQRDWKAICTLTEIVKHWALNMVSSPHLFVNVILKKLPTKRKMTKDPMSCQYFLPDSTNQILMTRKAKGIPIFLYPMIRRNSIHQKLCIANKFWVTMAPINNN